MKYFSKVKLSPETWIGIGAIVLTFGFFLSFLVILGPVEQQKIQERSGRFPAGIVRADPSLSIQNVADGAHDATEVLQSAILSTPPKGRLELPSGKFLISAPLRIRKPMTITGAFSGRTVISRLQPQNENVVVDLNETSDPDSLLKIQNISLSVEGDLSSSGTGFLIKTGTVPVEIENLSVSKFKIGIDIQATASVSIRDVKVDQPSMSGVRYTGGASADLIVENLKVIGGDRSLQATGITINGGENISLSNVLLTGLNIGGLFKTEARSLKKVFVEKLQSKKNRSDGLVIESIQENLDEILMVSSQFEMNNGHGIRAFGGKLLQLEIKNCELKSNGGHGVLLEGIEHVKMENDVVFNNSREKSNTHHGISVGRDVKQVRFSNLKVGNAPDLNYGQLYGIYIFGRGTDSIELFNNTLAGNGHPCPYTNGCASYKGRPRSL